MMRTRVVASGKKPHRFEMPWIRSIKNSHAVAEHMADIKVVPVHHDLHGVGPPANIAVCDMAESVPYTFRRNRNVFGRSIRLGKRKNGRRRSHSEQSFQIFPAIHRDIYSAALAEFQAARVSDLGLNKNPLC